MSKRVSFVARHASKQRKVVADSAYNSYVVLMDDNVPAESAPEPQAFKSPPARAIRRQYPKLKLRELYPPRPGHIYVDGSCLGQGTKRARAGVGVFFGPDDPLNVSERLPGPTQTSTRAEIYAAIRALELTAETPMVQASVDGWKETSKQMHKARSWTKAYRNPVIFTDCEALIIASKQINGWLKMYKRNYQNMDLLCMLSQAMQGRHVRFVHVRAHSGNKNHDSADALAKAGASRLARAGVFEQNFLFLKTED